jgi:D-3-phosphoglycerate dehydrogenase / 2-oxoglutarate reductase
MNRILLTTTSYQDTPGPHHQLLEAQGYEIVRERGPLGEERMLELAGEFDAFLCGDDAITARVIDKALPRLKVISKYGIGLDKIDVATATARRLPVLFTPGVNHTTVAEHAFCLALALVRNLVDIAVATRAGRWLRPTGHELWQKSMGVFGLGRIGKEVVKRARGFDMPAHGFDIYWPEDFAAEYGVVRHASVESLFAASDVLSLHANLSPETHHVVNAERLALLPDGAILLNTSRGELVDNHAVLAALDSGKLAGYGADVLDVEPPPPDHPLLRHPKALITSHIGSRTYESVPRQAMMATRNLVAFLSGEGEFHQANRF